MKSENTFGGISGYTMIVVLLGAYGISIFGIAIMHAVWMIGLAMLATVLVPGFYIINPNEACVMTLFGAYKGSAKENGFYWANPFLVKKKLSLRVRNLDSQPIKVNDKIGNPIMIGIVMVWRVSDTFKAAFEVNDYESFVRIQAESAIRKLAGSYP